MLFRTPNNTDDYIYKQKTVKSNYGNNTTQLASSLNKKSGERKHSSLVQSKNAFSNTSLVKPLDTSGFNSNASVLKRNYTKPKLPDFTTNTIKDSGSIIKNNITNVLSRKYGELDTRHIFDDIDDEDVENNISTAETTIKTNIDRGLLSNDVYSTNPNLRDELALSYAAANKGKSKAAKRAREAAYDKEGVHFSNDEFEKMIQCLSNNEVFF